MQAYYHFQHYVIVMHARHIVIYKLIFFKYALCISDMICFTVIPAGTIQIATQGEGVPGLHTLTMSNAATAGGAIVQYAQGQDPQFFVPGVLLHHFRDVRKSYFISQCFVFMTLLYYSEIIHYCNFSLLAHYYNIVICAIIV